jgi:hypothetical protein
MTDLGAHYLEEAHRQLRGYKRLAEAAMDQLNDEDFFVTLDPESNSVVILVKHIVGNMRSRFTDFLTTDGEKPDRNRDQEFEMVDKPTRAEIMAWWEEGWERVFSTIAELKPEELLHTVTIRAEPHTVLQAINRQLAHYSAHVAQIIFLAKHLRSSHWKSLSIPRGRSKDFNASRGHYNRGLPREEGRAS